MGGGDHSGLSGFNFVLDVIFLLGSWVSGRSEVFTSRLGSELRLLFCSSGWHNL
jgi:hypothetical protein